MANITVNGEQRKFNGDPNLPLLWYLRDEVGLTGTKFGCGVGVCVPVPSMSMARLCAHV
jgi:isoquinoline 1-oxidoreductase subunit alpha